MGMAAPPPIPNPVGVPFGELTERQQLVTELLRLGVLPSFFKHKPELTVEQLSQLRDCLRQFFAKHGMSEEDVINYGI